MSPAFSSPVMSFVPISPESPLAHWQRRGSATPAAKVADLKFRSTTAIPKPAETVSGFESYLTQYSREAIEMTESPVHTLIDIMSSEKDAYMHTTKLSDLQKFLSVYFVEDIVAGIICYYDELASLWPIPKTYLSKYSLSQLAESVALDLHASSSTFTPITLSSMVGDSGVGFQSSQGGQGGQQGSEGGGQGGRGSQGGDRGGRGRGGRGRGGRGQGGGGQGVGGHGDRGLGGGQEDMLPLCPEGRLFRDSMPTIIPVYTFITPRKKSGEQKSTIRRAAQNFLSNTIVKDLQSKAYDPYEDVTVNDIQKTRLLFHGTRKSRLYNFEIYGVNPQWRANELCADRAFYVTNSIEQAIAHVLYVCPRSPLLDVDPIVVLVFSVDVTVLHGYQPSPSPSVTFSVNWFRHDDPEHNQNFLKYAERNLRLARPSPTLLSKHIQIGPICLPIKPHPVILENWTEQDISLTQVAACSKEAFDFFSNSLLQILEEKRNEVAPS